MSEHRAYSGRRCPFCGYLSLDERVPGQASYIPARETCPVQHLGRPTELNRVEVYGAERVQPLIDALRGIGETNQLDGVAGRNPKLARNVLRDTGFDTSASPSDR